LLQRGHGSGEATGDYVTQVYAAVFSDRPGVCPCYNLQNPALGDVLQIAPGEIQFLAIPAVVRKSVIRKPSTRPFPSKFDHQSCLMIKYLRADFYLALMSAGIKSVVGKAV
ncbi:MAG TPA: hypothetical protein V6C72_10540, partial [Chroococcales cyanobacterium]